MPSGTAAMPTIGALIAWAPRDPRKSALPNAKTPPSAAASQYPLPSGAAAMPTMGAVSTFAPSDPKNAALPNPPTSGPRSTGRSADATDGIRATVVIRAIDTNHRRMRIIAASWLRPFWPQILQAEAVDLLLLPHL